MFELRDTQKSMFEEQHKIQCLKSYTSINVWRAAQKSVFEEQHKNQYLKSNTTINVWRAIQKSLFEAINTSVLINII